MFDWVYECILTVFRHYKEMTAFVLVVTILKISIPIFFSWLNKRMEKKHHRQRVKLWTDTGCSEQEAEEIIRRFDDSVREEIQKKSFLSSIKKFISRTPR